MKKKKIIIIVIIAIFILMLIPIKDRLWDGGSTEYKAVLYKYTKIHRISQTSSTGYEDGWELKILGFHVAGEINTYVEAEQQMEEIVSCLENELGGYLVTEQDNLIDIPISEIKNVNIDKIEIFKGKYASNHKDNMYFIIFPKNGTYEAEVMNNFEEYFSKKFSIYQMFTSPVIPTIYIHTENNDIDMKTLTNKCVTNNVEQNSKSLPTSTINKINKTNKIIIKSGEKELGVIKGADKIKEILDAVSSANRYGDVCLSDGHGFDFEMYNDNKLIDTIQVWGDGKRILPRSINGCYYFISNGTDLRKIIEDETDYIFYTILDYSKTCADALELVYENNGHKYYLSCIKSDKVLIKFMINNKVMTLKSALENNLISADKVASEYPDILIKKW
mgnify:CR=1 FL=1